METIYEDFAPKGVRFYYLYKALAHPELNGYVKPFTLEERLMHVREAQRTLGSKITWICDTMANDAKHALGNRPNSEFVIDPDGKIARMRTWSNPQQLRRDLEELVGPVPNPTRVSDLDRATAPPPKVAPRGVVPRIETPGRMRAVKIEPKMGKTPFYAKLRAEATRELLRTGSGKLYLGFHLDPIYRVHWNNLVAPVAYEIKSPDGTAVTPASGEGPQVKAASDIDPREFLVDVEGGNASEPLELTVRYFACNDAEGWCIPVTQEYEIALEPDPDGGQRRAPSAGGRGSSPRGRAGMIARLMDSDRNGDGKIARDELPERMQARFDAMDRDGDGFIGPDELKSLAERMGRGRPDRRSRAVMAARLMENDRNGDGKIARDELPERMQARFDAMDRDGDGFIDQDELKSLTDRMGRGRPGGRERPTPPENR